MIPDREYLLEVLRAAKGHKTSEAELAEWLYCDCFTVRWPAEPMEAAGEEESIADDLSAANNSRASWDPDWTVEFADDDGALVAHKEGARRWFQPGEFITLRGPGHRSAQSETISIFVARESRLLQESFYFAFGETVNPFGDSEDQVRLYWNVSLEGIGPLMSAITREFNRFQVPFRFKCGHKRSHFRRMDAAVLYVPRFYWSIVRMLIERIYPQVADGLGAETPAFTKRLAPGLALTEDPPGGKSFGQNRCAVLADACTAIRERGAESDEARLEIVAEKFRGRGLDLARPYLNPGSRDAYEPLS